ncbi:YfhO family protein [Lactobacillus psittaci]|uniref:YfhO family protein n=1 Tax=Lactobacillus psittaci DSM 15354 TaxID=1122152 RepID=A0A0R1SDW5_9LACO|nr:YfhO family protein [Lactobacillus psittaci]KRL63403.1 hypothetical protein FC23_GL000643 [Lactobacillus psittaci DSM 15354]
MKQIINHFSDSQKQLISYLAAFGLPFIIFLSYFLVRHGQILTVDLGQQYIDLLAHYRQSLLHNPAELIFSFANGLGSSMVATDFYYLASPVNLILLLIPLKFFPTGILILISIKVGLIGLSAFYYFKGENKTLFALAASLAYALCGYVIAYNLNLMWLDSVILLPLLILAIKKQRHLVLVTFLCWFTNFYTGYMVLAFGLFYFLTELINADAKLAKFKFYLSRSILGTLLASFVLIPAVSEILSGKGDSTSWTLSFQFNFWKLFGKFFTGSYSFHEMEAGLPNVYISIFLLLIALLYFFNRQIALKVRLSKLVLLIFLFLSTCFNPLVLLWHIGQYPTWYPARFSFVICFYLIELAFQNLANLQYFTKIQGLVLIIFIALASIIIKFGNFAFLNSTKLIITVLFILITLLFVVFLSPIDLSSQWLIYGLTALAMTVNLVLSLNELAYQSNADWSNFTANMRAATSQIRSSDSNLYRLEKTFSRSDDDSFSDDYYGLANFNSITSTNLINFLSYQGLVHNSNSFSNKFSTALLDQLLGVKYYLLPNLDHDDIPANQLMKYNNRLYRPDLKASNFVENYPELYSVSYRNSLPLLFVSPKTKKANFISEDPTRNQQTFFTSITGSKVNLFSALLLPDPVMKNASLVKKDYLQFQAKSGISKISFWFKPVNNASYYLELPADLDNSDVSLYINNHYVSIDARYSQIKLVNLAANQKNIPIKISFIMHSHKLDLTNSIIWQLDTDKLNSVLSKFRAKQPNFQYSKLVITSDKFKTQAKQTLKTTIPYSHDWFAFDKGKLVKVNKYLNTFLQVNISPGYHQIQLIFIPVELIAGLLISLTCLIFMTYQKSRLSKR